MAALWSAERSRSVSRASESLSASSSPTVRRSRVGTGVRLPDQLGNPRMQRPKRRRWIAGADSTQQLLRRCRKLCRVVSHRRWPLQPDPAGQEVGGLVRRCIDANGKKLVRRPGTTPVGLIPRQLGCATQEADDAGHCLDIFGVPLLHAHSTPLSEGVLMKSQAMAVWLEAALPVEKE